MTEQEIEKLRSPIGPYIHPDIITKDIIEGYISIISSLPGKLIREVDHLTLEQLDTRYRPEGWTIRQVVHHFADSHMHGFIRTKLVLTEEVPIVKPYFEQRWAELVDSTVMPIEPSLQIISGIHSRWVILLKSLKEKDFQKTLFHPEQRKLIRLDYYIGSFAWHSNHHLAHITELKKRKQWK